MTEEQQRIAIAKACGLTIVSDGITHHLTPCGKKTEHDPEGCLLKECPDYLNDLNAMHEAEEMMIEKDQSFKARYRIKLVFNSDYSVDNRQPHWRATAAQRAEAFLRTIGKWTTNPNEL